MSLFFISAVLECIGRCWLRMCLRHGMVISFGRLGNMPVLKKFPLSLGVLLAGLKIKLMIPMIVGKMEVRGQDSHLILISPTVYMWWHVILSLLCRPVLVYPLAVSHYSQYCCKKRFPGTKGGAWRRRPESKRGESGSRRQGQRLSWRQRRWRTGFQCSACCCEIKAWCEPLTPARFCCGYSVSWNRSELAQGWSPQVRLWVTGQKNTKFNYLCIGNP